MGRHLGSCWEDYNINLFNKNQTIVEKYKNKLENIIPFATPCIFPVQPSTESLLFLHVILLLC